MATKTDHDLQSYLDALARCGVRTKAARAAGMTYATVRKYIEEDEDFAKAEAIAFEEAADFLETAAWDRATEGYVQTVTEYRKNKDGEDEEIERKRFYPPSDSLLTTLLKASRPDKFADRSKSEVTGKDGERLLDDTATAAKLASIFANAKERREADVGDDPLFT